MKKLKDTEFTRAVKEHLDTWMKVCEEYIKDEVAPLMRYGVTPEEMFGPYKTWSAGTVQMAQQVFGDEVAKFIGKNEIEAMHEAESEVV